MAGSSQQAPPACEPPDISGKDPEDGIVTAEPQLVEQASVKVPRVLVVEDHPGASDDNSAAEESDDAGSDADESESSCEEATDDELMAPEAAPDLANISQLAAVDGPADRASGPESNAEHTAALGPEGHSRALASVPTPSTLTSSSTYPEENLPPKTGLCIPMMKNQPDFIRAVPKVPELIYIAPDSLFDEIVRLEADRISHRELVKNKIVFDSVESPQGVAPPVEAARPNEAKADPGRVSLTENLPPYYTLTGPDDTTLIFESRFESGNLRRAVQVYDYEYDLILNPDYNTKVHTQWFFFGVSNTRKGQQYRFNIINMVKPTSVYNDGMRPLIYSAKNAADIGVGWVRGCEGIAYYQNGIRRKERNVGGDKGTNYYTLTFTITFEHDNDSVYFTHCYPYTYTDLQKDLLEFEKDPAIQKIFRRRKLCETLAGNACDLITITSFNSDPAALRSRRAVVISARVHPGESNASWIMKGMLDYLTGTSLDARLLRDNFVFKIVPMLNPDGVIVGNYRCSLAGTDLNREWGDPSRKMHPTIFFAKSMIRHLMHDRDVVLYVDIHGHSRKKNVFMYGNSERQGIREKIFPRLLSKSSDCFCFDDCCFKIQKSKESTARVVAYRELTITNAFTLEASFCGADFGALADQHFTTRHLEEVGFMVCDAILDFCDPDQSKISMVCKELQLLFPDDGNSDDVSDSEVDDKEKARMRRARRKKQKEKLKRRQRAASASSKRERQAQDRRDRVVQELIAEGLAVGDGSLPARELSEADKLRNERRNSRLNREHVERGWTSQDAAYPGQAPDNERTTQGAAAAGAATRRSQPASQGQVEASKGGAKAKAEPTNQTQADDEGGQPERRISKKKKQQKDKPNPPKRDAAAAVASATAGLAAAASNAASSSKPSSTRA